YADHLAAGTGERPLSKRFVDDAKVTDHHALLPTAVPPEGLSLSAAERRIYDLVCRRLLMAWHAEHVFSVTTVITRVTGPAADPALDRYHATGTVVDVVVWKVLEPEATRPTAPPRAVDSRPESEGRADAAQALPAGLTAGLPVVVADVKAVPKRTR